MRRLANLLLIWVILLTLVACGSEANNPSATPRPGSAATGGKTPPPLLQGTPTPAVSPATVKEGTTTAAPIVAPSKAAPAGNVPFLDNGVNLAPPPAPFPPAGATPVRPDLKEYEESMLAAFKGDVKLAQDLGAPFYNIAVRVVPDAKTPEVAGREQVIYTNDTGGPLDSVYFGLWANLAPSTQNNPPVSVSNVRLNGEAANWTLENNRSMVRVRFDPNRLLAPGAMATIEMDFSLRVSTDSDYPYFKYSPAEQVLNLCYWYPQVAVFDKAIGGWDIHNYSEQGDVTNSKTSFFKVWLTLPREPVIAANGRRVEVNTNSDGTKTAKFVTGPVRDFVVAFSPQYQTASQQSGDSRVTAYFFEKDRAWGEKMLQHAVDSLKTFSDAFGQYPYQDYSVAETVLTTFGGLEFPGLIYITTRYFNPDAAQSLEYVTVHETGHQWWYGLVGSDQLRHPFQDEALTQYVPVLYFERFKSKAEAQRILQIYMKNGFQATVTAGRDAIVDQPVYNWNQFNDYLGIVYNKGGLFYDAYRQKFGDAAFLKFARSYLQNNRYKFAQPDDILEALKAGVAPAQSSAVTELYRHWLNAKEGQQDIK